MNDYIDPDTGDCLYCDGSGECPRCRGEGEIRGDDCPICDGSTECPNCQGYGYIDIPIRRRRSPRSRNMRSHHDSPHASSFRVELTRGNSNYRGHCMLVIAESYMSDYYKYKFRWLLPKHVPYDSFVGFAGIIESEQSNRLIHEQVWDLFETPLLIRIIDSLFERLRGTW